MPAITVDDLTVLPRLREPGLGDQPRPVWQVTTAPSGLRGRGVPGAPRVRRHRPPAPRPVHHDGPDGRGGVRARRGQGHPLAPAPRLRDRHLHHRRRLRPPGQPRWRRHHHQRRHPVDDRRLRAPAHRGAAGVAGAAGRPVPRHPALGEPPARRQDEQPEVPGHPLRRGPAAHLAPTRVRWSGSSPGTVDGHAGPGSTYTPMSLVHATIEPGARLDLPVGRRLQRAGLRAQRQRHGRHRGPADPHGPVRRARRRRLPHDHRRPAARRAARPSST